MSDNPENTFTTEADASVEAEGRVGAADVPAPTVVAQEAKLVGEEANGEPLSREDAVSVTSETVPAQVVQPRESDPSEVNVHEVSVVTDEVITDTSDPRAVQVPPEGYSPLVGAGLPIARLDAERVEDVFAREAPENTDDKS
jgi:hypothetical protein